MRTRDAPYVLLLLFSADTITDNGQSDKHRASLMMMHVSNNMIVKHGNTEQLHKLPGCIMIIIIPACIYYVQQQQEDNPLSPAAW